MKRSVLAGLMITAMASAPVFASGDDLCTINLQKLNDAKATASTMDESAKGELDTAIAKAKAEQAAKDDKACISTTTQAIQKVANMHKGDGGASGGNGQ